MEQGPMTTKRRGSLRARMSHTVLRPRTTVSVAVPDRATPRLTASGVGIASMPTTLTSSSRVVFMAAIIGGRLAVIPLPRKQRHDRTPPPAAPRRSRTLLDADDRQPRVQGGPPPGGCRQGHALHR